MAFVENSQAFQQCKNFEKRLRFDKVTESLKVGTFFETQCSNADFVCDYFIVLIIAEYLVV